MKNHEITIDYSKCIGCGLCSKICVAKNIDMNNKKANLISRDCIKCGQCSAICPKEAISISGYENEPVYQNTFHRLNPNEVLDVIRFRRTIRHFQQKEISPAIIKQILEAGRLTHTAKNMQDVSFLVLDSEKNKMEQIAVSFFKKLKPLANIVSPMARRQDISDHFFFFKAPIAIVVLAKEKENGFLASQNMEFVAESYGLGVLYSGFFTTCANYSRKLKKQLAISKEKKAVATLVVGYPSVKFLRSTQHEPLDVTYK